VQQCGNQRVGIQAEGGEDFRHAQGMIDAPVSERSGLLAILIDRQLPGCMKPLAFGVMQAQRQTLEPIAKGLIPRAIGG